MAIADTHSLPYTDIRDPREGEHESNVSEGNAK